jgi:hypothetical protein
MLEISFGYDGLSLMAQVAGDYVDELVLNDDGQWVTNDYADEPPAPDWVNEEVSERARLFLLCAQQEGFLKEDIEAKNAGIGPPACGNAVVIERFAAACERAREIMS